MKLEISLASLSVVGWQDGDPSDLVGSTIGMLETVAML
jgi:hypothetical protein